MCICFSLNVFLFVCHFDTRTNTTESGESNSVHIKTSPSRLSDSGSVSIQTGSSAGGNGGDISLETGASDNGTPGSIRLLGGDSGAAGGDVQIQISAGDASDDASVGGSIDISAGMGLSSNDSDGGNGGDITLVGGHSLGLSENDAGGSVEIHGGIAISGDGGKSKSFQEAVNLVHLDRLILSQAHQAKLELALSKLEAVLPIWVTLDRSICQLENHLNHLETFLCRLAPQQTLEAEVSTLQQVTALAVLVAQFI